MKKSSNTSYEDGDPRNAVISRFNAMWQEKQGTGEEVDWAALIAELIHAYMAGAPKPDLAIRAAQEGK